MDVSTAQRFSSYALTLNPRDGVNDEVVSAVTQWIKKRCLYYHIVTEKTGTQRHVHAALYLRIQVTRSNLTTVWLRELKKFDFDTEEISVARKGVRILYSNDFIDNYLNKDDDTVVIESCLPEKGELTQYYPPKPLPTTTSRKRKCSAFYHELEELWHKHKRPLLEVNTENCRHFLFNMMYNERCINVIRDDKTIIQTARHLTRWLNHAHESTIQLAPFEIEE